MGTNYIAPTWRQPENTNKDKLSNYSIDTDGTGVGVDCGPMVDLFGTTSVTYNTSYSIWIKPEFNYNDSTYQTFYGNYTTGVNGVLLYYHTGDDRWRFLVGDGSGGNFVQSNTITSNEELGKGEWQHHCVVFDTENDNAYYYINNQQINSSTSLNKKIATNANFYIGKKWDLAGGKWAGQISQACVFNYALSTNQRTYLYNLNNPMAISGTEPIAYWPLGDNSNPVATAGYPNISVGADSVFNFASTNERIDTPAPYGDGNQGDLTISAWVKQDSLQNAYTPILCTGMTTNMNTMQIAMALRNIGGNRLYLFYNGSGGSNYIYAQSVMTEANRWYNVAFVRSGSTGKLYVDGQEVSTLNSADFSVNPAVTTSDDNMTLGAWRFGGGTSSLLGELTNVCVWKTALTDGVGGQIEQLYNNGVPLLKLSEIPQAANLKAWYKLNQSANWEADSAGEWQIPDALSAYPQSFSFNGVDDQINLGLESDLSLGGASKYSTSLWFKKDSNGTNCFWGYNYGDPSGSGFYLWQSSGAFRVAVGNNSLTTGFGYYNIASTNVPIGEWINIVVVFDGTLASGNDRIKVYQNGEPATGTYTNGSNFPATLPNGNGASDRNVYLGQLQLANGSFSYSFDGKMSNVMQWTTDLSLSDATAIYNNGVPLPTASVQASSLKTWYKLDNTAVFFPTQQYWGIPNAASTSNILNFSN